MIIKFFYVNCCNWRSFSYFWKLENFLAFLWKFEADFIPDFLFQKLFARITATENINYSSLFFMAKQLQDLYKLFFALLDVSYVLSCSKMIIMILYDNNV